jgi:5-methylcytosine-specific restriction endonuclease McrA
VSAQFAHWATKHPDKARLRVSRRRALKMVLTVGKITATDIAAKWAYWGGLCWMCGARATETDHVKPLAKGGAHLLCNLRPICRSCNSRKKARWPVDTSRRAR